MWRQKIVMCCQNNAKQFEAERGGVIKTQEITIWINFENGTFWCSQNSFESTEVDHRICEMNNNTGM